MGVKILTYTQDFDRIFTLIPDACVILYGRQGVDPSRGRKTIKHNILT